MEEQLLQFIWHQQLFDSTRLVTTEGHPIVIYKAGTPNDDQGPDFLQARIQLGEQIWAGHVEIHIRSSMWFLHRHEVDAHYNNVILHVVWDEDRPALTADGFRVPCLELKDRIDHQLLDRYRHLMNNKEWVPCASGLQEVNDLVKTSWLGRLMAERLESKTELIHYWLEKCRYDWEQVFFILLARQMGSPVNGEAMEVMAERTNLKLLRKHGDQPKQVEAILFGVAGMLHKQIGLEYPHQLKREFDFLKKKYDLKPVPGLQWKFMRMRPAHYPTLRIAQLARIVLETTHFITLLENKIPASAWLKRFQITPLNDFWKDHYHFAAKAPPGSKKLGKSTAIAMVINVVVPVMFYYGKHQGRADLKEAALKLWQELPPEENSIVKNWRMCGWPASDAGETQALLQLKKRYCDQQRCLHCAIGLQLVRQ